MSIAFHRVCSLPDDALRAALRFHPLFVPLRARVCRRAALAASRRPSRLDAYFDLVALVHRARRAIAPQVLISFLVLVNAIDHDEWCDGWWEWVSPRFTDEGDPEYDAVSAAEYSNNAAHARLCARAARTREDAVRAMLRRPLSRVWSLRRGLVGGDHEKTSVNTLIRHSAFWNALFYNYHRGCGEYAYYDTAEGPMYELTDWARTHRVGNALDVSCSGADYGRTAPVDVLVGFAHVAFECARFFVGSREFDVWYAHG